MENQKTHADRPPVVLLLGNARPNEYRYFKDAGLKMVMLHDRHCPIARPPDEDFEAIVAVDFSGEEPIRVFRDLTRTYHVAAQMAAVETAVLDNARLAIETSLPAPSVEAATLALDKARMRQAFIDELGADSTSRSAPIESEAQLLAFARDTPFPIVLKPTNLFGSMFVLTSRDIWRLLADYRRMARGIREYLDASGRAGDAVEIQAESFLEGSSHSIDCVVDANGVVHPTEFVDVLTERSFGGDKVQHYARFAPSLLPPDQQEAGKLFCRRAVKALGLASCVAHVEFIQTADGPRLLEIAARPGGNRVHLMKEVFGIELMAQYYAALTGGGVCVAPLHTRPRAIVSVYADATGAFAGIDKVPAIEALPGYVRHSVRGEPGEIVGPAREGFLPTLGIELESPTSAGLLDRINALRSLGPLVRVHTP